MLAPAVAGALVAAFANVLGGAAVAVRRRWTTVVLELMIALSAGFMLSVAIADMLPEAIAHDGASAGRYALLGFLLVHITQHVFVRHFHFGEETHIVARSVAGSALVGLLLHTLLDGVAIASAFAVTAPLGILVFGAITLHKLPEGLAIASLVLAAGGSRLMAVLAAATLGAATLVGVFLAGQSPALTHHGLALAAGVTIYVGASNLIPEFQGKPGWSHHAAFAAGCLMYLAARATFAPF